MFFTRDARVAAAAVAVFLVAATSKAQQEPDGFRFHGYLRSGFGVADDGKPQEAPCLAHTGSRPSYFL